MFQNRPTGGISEHKGHYAQQHEPMTDLPTIVRAVRPTILIGEINSRTVKKVL